MAAHRYWRVYITSLQGGNVATSCREIQLREVSGGASVATGGTALQSSGSGAANCFDGNTSTFMTIGSSAPVWVGYDFGGTPRDIVEFTYMADTAANAPSNMTLEWSDDAATWRTAYPVFSVTGWTDNQTRTFTQPVITTSSTVPSAPGNFLFIGSELEDFQQNVLNPSTIYNTTSTSFIRSGYPRAGVVLWGASPSYWLHASFTPSTTLGFTARAVFSTTSNNTTNYFMGLGVAAGSRLRIRRTSTTNPTTITLEKTDGTTTTSLGVSTNTITGGNYYKFDILVDSYGASGRVRVYVNQTLFIDTGAGTNIAVSGVTALDRLFLQSFHSLESSGINTCWSEVVVALEDTRPFSVVGLAPTAVGDANTNDSGGWGDIDDVTASDADAAVMSTAGQMLSVNVNGAPSGTSGYVVRAIKTTAYAARGSTGPTKLAIGLRSNAINAFNTAQTLDTGYGVVSAMWANNPVTSAAFTQADLETLQLVYRADS